ncbi:MAG: hypothetical protein K0Q83_4320, partial [Deltaproteobacteria bacterium]|nr:hypothetical protein [Deltaproteobacteria bacterium]
ALYQAIKSQGHMDVEFIDYKTSIAPQLAGRLVAGDVVLTLGAGDIYKVGESIVAALV